LDVITDFTPRVTGTTLYVNTTGSGGAFTKIQDAIDAANSGDTVFVYGGKYYENVKVNKTINLTGEDKDNTIIESENFNDVVLITADFVNLTGFEIINPSISFEDMGVELYNVHNCRIINNSFKATNFYTFSMIYIRWGGSHNITGNNITARGHAIHMDDSQQNIISANTISDGGIDIFGSSLEHWNTHTIDTLNNIDGKPVHYWKNQTAGDIPSGAGQVILANCTNVTIQNQVVTNTSIGIQLGFSDNITIISNEALYNDNMGIRLYESHDSVLHSNNVSYNNWGFYLDSSPGSNIKGNNVSYNEYSGIYLTHSNGSLIEKNNVFFNDDEGIRVWYSINCTINNNNVTNNQNGIYLHSSNENKIINNNISNNNGNGIYLGFSDDNKVAENYVFSNERYGVEINSGEWNNITGNNIRSNRQQGIHLRQFASYNNITYNDIISNDLGIVFTSVSDNNMVFHNNFITNTNQAYDATDGDNQWDDGYPQGGNFWSDYKGDDNYKGPLQDQIGSDGIGDTNYTIETLSVDNYPLMRPTGDRIFLYQGWNLISLPFIQIDTNPVSVLSSIPGAFDSLQRYNASDSSDSWKHNSSSKPSSENDLDDLDHLMGFWIHITEPNGVLFEYQGSQPAENQTITLHPGWNMVGYPSLSNPNRSVGLNNLTFGVDIDSIQWFDASTKTWHFLDQDDYFVPGRGYWIHSKIDTTWEVPL
jgi:parallel beta-helix repeat protein